ncbi:hypothetical protein WG66_004139 [Moniliophthora roreri]|nr:hypothetical protein WG66_004139 [Moniliophthora roreri]
MPMGIEIEGGFILQLDACQRGRNSQTIMNIGRAHFVEDQGRGDADASKTTLRSRLTPECGHSRICSIISIAVETRQISTVIGGRCEFQDSIRAR